MMGTFILLCLICVICEPSYVVTEARVLINKTTEQSTSKATTEMKVTIFSRDMTYEDFGDFLKRPNLVPIPKAYNWNSIDKKDSMMRIRFMRETVSRARRILYSPNYNEEELLRILPRFHKCDYGKIEEEFANSGAFGDIFVPSLSKSAKVQEKVLRILHEVLESHDRIVAPGFPLQTAALESGLLNKFLAIIRDGKDPMAEIAVYDLSELLWRFPKGQRALLDLGGLELLNDIFKVVPLSIQASLLDLIYDIRTDYSFAHTRYLRDLDLGLYTMKPGSGIEDVEWANERPIVFLGSEKLLAKAGWCLSFLNFLINILEEGHKIHEQDMCSSVLHPEHDTISIKLLELMSNLKESCIADYKNSTALPCAILRFSKQYKALKRCYNEELWGGYTALGQNFRQIGKHFFSFAWELGKAQPLLCDGKDEL